jgi:predicted acetyltransferase
MSGNEPMQLREQKREQDGMVTIKPTITPMRPEERPALEQVLKQALHFEPARMTYWMEGAGPANYRVVRAAGRPIGGLAILPTGQWFGGQRVPMAGIGSVGVAPEWRGRGAASTLLRGMLTELQETGVPLATLYPSTLPVYRKAGFERAGSTITYSLNLANINPRAPLALLPLATDAWQPFAAIRDRWLSQQHGAIERSPFLWRKILSPFGQETYAYQIVRGDTPEGGYLIYTQGSKGMPLQVLDWCIGSRDAGMTLFAFLAGDRSMVTTATLRAAAEDPLLQLLPEQGAMVNRAQAWLLRIVDVVGALSARGYPPALNAELEFAVTDDLLPTNAGAFTLRIAAGRGEVTRAGAGRLRIDIRALASLYTGYLSASQLASIGALDGPADDLALADLVFSGARPRLIDGV